MKKKNLKSKIREFDSDIKTNFLGNGLPKVNMCYTCFAYIIVNSAMKMKKKKKISTSLFRRV